MNFNVGEVLSRAWKIIWKHKILWIFGILASCARGNGGGGGNTGYRASSGNGQPPFSGSEFQRLEEQITHWITENLWIIIAIIVALFLFSLFLYFIGFMGKISLIKGTYKADGGAESLNFGELFSESLPYFWRVFGLNFLIGLAFVIVFLIILIPVIFLGFVTVGIGLLCILPLICILIPVSWAISVILEQASNAIVIEDLRMFEGLKRGWEVSRTNFGPLIIMALILLFGGGIVSVIIALPMFLVFIPLIPSLITGEFQRSSLILTALCCVGLFPVILFLNGVLTAYLQSAWTLTYMRLTAPKADAPVIIEANA